MQNSILKKLLQILLIILISTLIGSLFCVIIITVCNSKGINLLENVIWMKILQSVFQLLIFLLPSTYFLYFNKINISDYWGLRKRQNFLTILSVTLLLLFAAPVVNWLTDINSKINFPENWSSISNWLNSREAETKELTDKFLNTSSYWSLIGNIFVMALIPAICEESLFRGCIQKILTDSMKSYHIAIIITAIIFSAVHLEFSGFIPRIYLGLILGYVFYYTGSIWMSSLIHFLNNLSAVILQFWEYNFNSGQEYHTALTDTNIALVIVSLIVTTLLMLYLSRLNKVA